ncbi:hypothetical protein Lser_V15G26003 [Lactuca serriola]
MVQNRCKQEDGQWWCLVVGAKMNGADSGIWLFVYVANIQIGLQIYAVSSVKGLKGFLRHGLLEVPNLISINFSDQRFRFLLLDKVTQSMKQLSGGQKTVVADLCNSFRLVALHEAFWCCK